MIRGPRAPVAVYGLGGLGPTLDIGAQASPTAPLQPPGSAPTTIDGSPYVPPALYAIDDLVSAALVAAALEGPFSVTVASASTANDATADLDFSSVCRTLVDTRARADQRWRILGVYGLFNGSGAGPWRIDQWRAGGYDLGHDLIVKAMYLPVGALLPSLWDGSLTVRATNRSGGASTLFATLWLAPVTP